MARLAIFIDGAYLENLAKDHFGGVRIDFDRFANEVRGVVAANTPEPVDILRTLYYHCPPYQGNPPSPDDKYRYDNFRRFADALKNLKRFEFREGRTALRGYDRDGNRIFQQKRVDLLLGLDFALLSGKHQISHIALVAGDSDLIPAVQLAKQEGVSVWLFHGPRATYHQDLWQEADERHELAASFMNRCARA